MTPHSAWRAKECPLRIWIAARCPGRVKEPARQAAGEFFCPLMNALLKERDHDPQSDQDQSPDQQFFWWRGIHKGPRKGDPRQAMGRPGLAKAHRMVGKAGVSEALWVFYKDRVEARLIGAAGPRVGGVTFIRSAPRSAEPLTPPYRPKAGALRAT
jgi:hypothetical protein